MGGANVGEKHSGVGTLYFGSRGVNGDLDWTPVGTFSELDISAGSDLGSSDGGCEPRAHSS